MVCEQLAPVEEAQQPAAAEDVVLPKRHCGADGNVNVVGEHISTMGAAIEPAVHQIGAPASNEHRADSMQPVMQTPPEVVAEEGYQSIRLDTYSGNPKAMEFYRRLGYTELGTIDLKPEKDKYYCFEKIIK